MTLQSLACGKVRVLRKEPKGREVENEDVFFFDSNFKHQASCSRRIGGNVGAGLSVFPSATLLIVCSCSGSRSIRYRCARQSTKTSRPRKGCSKTGNTR